MPADRWVGQVLGGRYQIEELIGQGGMSAVYKAYDPNLRRTVAIKLIHPHLSDNEEFVRRFESEATAIARLRHGNIVQVFDFNHDGDLYYMVLEFVAGETLQARIKRMNAAGRHMPIRDVLRYLIDVCKAADYAHQRGMIHRDIKPANVMLDVNGSAILMDFGIARILGGQHQTATGAVLGTALYMSPEQIQGLHPDARSDIYSIGVTLFEALGGRPPFEADSAMTLMMMHLHDPVPDINQLHPGIPEAVRAIVNRSLEKDRNDRYQSGGEMAAALEQALPWVIEEKATGPRPSVPVVPAPTPAPPPQKKPAAAPAEKPQEAPAPERKRAKPAARPKPAPQEEPVPARAPVEETLVEPAAPRVPVPGRVPVPERVPVPARVPPAEKPSTPLETIVEAAPPVKGTMPSARPVADTLAQAPAAVAAPPVQLPTHRRIPVPGIVAAVLLVLAVGGFLIFRLLSPPTTPAAPTDVPLVSVLATATVKAAQPTVAPSLTPTLAPTATFTPEPTPTEAAPVVPVVGGADLLAFVVNKDVWIANVDGTGARQLTADGTLKDDLRWLPDGEGLSYISGKCLQTVDLQGSVALVTCFNNATYFDSFEVSPDGTRVALSLDRQLYLLPFDLARLAQADSHPDLVAMADCKELAPYQRSAVLYSRWSKDGKQLAAVVLGVLADGRRGEVVHLFAVDQCIANPLVKVQFPEPHFTFGEYKSDPELPGMAWDGESLFVINGLTRNEGFGNLHIFNRETFKATTNADPIDGVCCYRDPAFSPDGKYLLFAFQDITLGANSRTQIYYIPFGTLGAGAKYEPLPLPEYSDPKEAPQVVLRPAKQAAP